jgi:hypothetical protein
VEIFMKLEKNPREVGGQELMNGVGSRVQGNNEGRRKERNESCWHQPDQAAIKVNVDAAFNQIAGEEALGIIARDHVVQPHIMVWWVVH